MGRPPKLSTEQIDEIVAEIDLRRTLTNKHLAAKHHVSVGTITAAYWQRKLGRRKRRVVYA